MRLCPIVAEIPPRLVRNQFYTIRVYSLKTPRGFDLRATSPLLLQCRGQRAGMKILENLKPLGLPFLRLALGVIFCISGYTILFQKPAQALADFRSMGL